MTKPNHIRYLIPQSLAFSTSSQEASLAHA